MLVDTINVVKRPHKIRIEIRTHDNVSYTVTLATNSTYAVIPVVSKLRRDGYKYSAVYVDRYGYMRIIYKNLSWNDVMHIRSVAERYIAGRKSDVKKKDLLLASIPY
jgi:hypothetical protein